MIQVIRETHDTPSSIQEVLRLAGGVNRFGEPNYRACWGWNRLDWIGGKWEDRDEHGVLLREVVEFRMEPKYFPFNRWHIERWMPAESYGSPWIWHHSTLTKELGPYPSRGDYELSFTIEAPDGTFVQLTPEIARRAARLIEASRGIPKAKKKEALDDRMRREEREWDSHADSCLTDT